MIFVIFLRPWAWEVRAMFSSTILPDMPCGEVCSHGCIVRELTEFLRAMNAGHEHREEQFDGLCSLGEC